MDSEDEDLCPNPNGEEEELTLPRASVNKIIKELVSLKKKCLPNQ